MQNEHQIVPNGSGVRCLGCKNRLVCSQCGVYKPGPRGPAPVDHRLAGARPGCDPLDREIDVTGFGKLSQHYLEDRRLQDLTPSTATHCPCLSVQPAIDYELHKY